MNIVIYICYSLFHLHTIGCAGRTGSLKLARIVSVCVDLLHKLDDEPASLISQMVLLVKRYTVK